MQSGNVGKILAVFVILSIGVWKYYSPSVSTEDIAIVKITSHPALDRVTEGFKKETKFSCIEYNANGSIATLGQIYSDIKSKPLKGVFAISTPAAMAALKAKLNIPLVMGGVTSLPDGIENLSKTSAVSDSPDLISLINFMRDIYPKVDKFSIIYNPSDFGGVALVKEFKSEIAKFGGVAKDFCVTSSAEVRGAALAAMEPGSVLFVPLDNTIASGVAALIKVSREKAVPVFCCDPDLVKVGLFGGVGCDYYAVGTKAAEVMGRLQNGEKCELFYKLKSQRYVNKTMQKILNIDININDVNFVGE